MAYRLTTELDGMTCDELIATANAILAGGRTDRPDPTRPDRRNRND